MSAFAWDDHEAIVARDPNLAAWRGVPVAAKTLWIRPRDIARVHVCPAAEILLPDLEPAMRRIYEGLLRRPRDLILMAGSKSNYLAKKVIDEYFGATDYTAATNTHGALWTTTLDDTSTGSTGTEAAYTSYARVQKTNNSTTWPNSTGTTTATKSNGVAFGFPTSTGSTATCTYGAFCDASSAGNMLLWYSLTSSFTVNSGDTPNLASSGFSVTED
jgi:hypothetical protein